MRTPKELVDELVRELLPSSHDFLMVADIERRADEFGIAASRAEPGSLERAIAVACGDYLGKLHRSLTARAWRL